MSGLQITGLETRTPSRLTQPIHELCAEIAPEMKPRYVALSVEPDAIPSECFNNVRAKVSRAGGSIQHGWTIWEWPAVFIEAEFHAVWLSPDGRLVDVTPKEQREQQILFLPDPARVFEGRSVDNIRRAIRDDAFVHDFVRSSDMCRAEGLSDRQRQHLALHCGVLAELIVRGRRDTFSCAFCNSGLAYRRCCAGTLPSTEVLGSIGYRLAARYRGH